MLLPHDGMIGMSPQVGRVSVPMAGITRLRTSDVSGPTRRLERGRPEPVRAAGAV